ncbi:hypothetical protein EDB84DRAFT_1566120 [Lactarius hengduanensis]|nr:hypothetical protein EDB84DRAFT_1566120 [Lactarius hengduanensis]
MQGLIKAGNFLLNQGAHSGTAPAIAEPFQTKGIEASIIVFDTELLAAALGTIQRLTPYVFSNDFVAARAHPAAPFCLATAFASLPPATPPDAAQLEHAVWCPADVDMCTRGRLLVGLEKYGLGFEGLAT